MARTIKIFSLILGFGFLILVFANIDTTMLPWTSTSIRNSERMASMTAQNADKLLSNSGCPPLRPQSNEDGQRTHLHQNQHPSTLTPLEVLENIMRQEESNERAEEEARDEEDVVFSKQGGVDIETYDHRGKPAPMGNDKRGEVDATRADDKSKKGHTGSGTVKSNKLSSLSTSANHTRAVPRDILEMAPEIFEKVPRKFRREFKNPCWYDNHSALNCLPYFYIIGMPKCGTTELWDKLTAHPNVVSQVPKEPHWWARRRLGYTGTPIHEKQVLKIRAMTGGVDDSSIDWYLNWFKTFGVESVLSRQVETNSGDKYFPMVLGGASISTAFENPSWDEGKPTVADLLHAVQPGAKIIMIIRDPVDRYYSAYNYGRLGKNHTVTGFNVTSRSHANCFRRCLLQHSERYCAYVTKCDVHKGLYVIFAEEWMRVFGREGVLVLRLEDWHNNPAREYSKVLRFLQLPSLSAEDQEKILKREAKNVNLKKSKKPAMWDETRTELNQFYAPFNKRLADLLHDQKFRFNT